MENIEGRGTGGCVERRDGHGLRELELGSSALTCHVRIF